MTAEVDANNGADAPAAEDLHRLADDGSPLADDTCPDCGRWGCGLCCWGRITATD